jgi:hypothetical protein
MLSFTGHSILATIYGCRLVCEDIDLYLASLKGYPPSCVFLASLTLTLSRRERGQGGSAPSKELPHGRRRGVDLGNADHGVHCVCHRQKRRIWWMASISAGDERT